MPSTPLKLRYWQTSRIFAYNLGLCKMLSVATWKPLLLPTQLPTSFPFLSRAEKSLFSPTLPTLFIGKNAPSSERFLIENFVITTTKMWKTSDAFAEPVSHIYNNSDNNGNNIFFLFKSRRIQQKQKNFSGWKRLFAERKHKIYYRRKFAKFLTIIKRILCYLDFAGNFFASAVNNLFIFFQLKKKKYL